MTSCPASIFPVFPVTRCLRPMGRVHMTVGRTQSTSARAQRLPLARLEETLRTGLCRWRTTDVREYPHHGPEAPCHRKGVALFSFLITLCCLAAVAPAAEYAPFSSRPAQAAA